jgi:hypothetical protein
MVPIKGIYTNVLFSQFADTSPESLVFSYAELRHLGEDAHGTGVNRPTPKMITGFS